jgi:cytochrome c-type biogenesis protein CcsB
LTEGTALLKTVFNTGVIRGPSVGMLISNLSLFILLVLRWTESGHFPLSNLYESLMFLSWSLTFIHLFIELIFNSSYSYSDTAKKNIGFLGYLNMVGTKQKRKTLINKLIGSITAPSALFTNAFATFSLPKEMQESSPLVPALQSNWLMMHVTVMILSYAALILGSLLSIGFLVISSGKSSETTNNLIILNETSKSPKFIIGETQLTLDLNLSTWEQPNSPSSASNYSSVGTQVKENNRLNLAKTLDNLSYRILGLGFPLLTIGILSGAVWANEAWGSYWSWDPKETWALLTWLVFAIYLHTRLTKGWEGKKPALIASLGFVTVWICFLGVNLIGEGLHSYGWVS